MTTTHLGKPPLTRAADVTAAIAATVALVLLVLAGWVTYATATYVAAPHEDTSLVGVGYVVAAFIAVPAGVSALLAGAAVLLARRRRSGWALGVAIAALVVLLPAVLLLSASVGVG